MENQGKTQGNYAVNPYNNETIADQCDAPLPKEWISKREGRGSKVSYIRGDINAEQLNRIFGPLGWSLKVGDPRIEERIEKDRKIPARYNNEERVADFYVVLITTKTTLIIKDPSGKDRDTIFEQHGIGYGEIEDGKNRKEVIGMALKGAETDGFKRCTSMLGRAFGMFMTASGEQNIEAYVNHNAVNNRQSGSDRDDNRYSSRNQSGSGNRNSSGSSGGGQGGRSGYTRSNDSQRADSRSNNVNGNRNDNTQERRTTNEGGGREQERTDSSRSNERNTVDRSASNQDQRPAGEQGNRNSNSSSRSRNMDDPAPPPANNERTKATGDGNSENKAPERNNNSNAGEVNLEMRPVTRQDMIDYATALMDKVAELTQQAERERFVKMYIEQIRELPERIQTRLGEELEKIGVNLDTIQA